MASSGKSSTSSGFGSVLGSMAEKLFKETNPVVKQLMGQFGDVLSGNLYNGATLPLIQQGVNSARQSASAGLTGAESYLGGTGTSRSPFGAALMSMINQQGNQAVSNVPTNIGSQVLGMIPGATSSFTGQALSGMGTAGTLNTNANSTNFNYGQMIAGLQSGGAKSGGAKSGGGNSASSIASLGSMMGMF